MRLMGIDHGNRRIGIALSDPLGLFAQAHSILERQSLKKDFAQLNALIAEKAVELIVIGLPTDAQGGIGKQAQNVLAWSAYLHKAVTLPLYFWDESYTSEQAKEVAKQNKRSFDDPIDDIAAALLLQDYLQARGGGNEPGIPFAALKNNGE
jgi:putative Holliday junction resolvase